MMVRLFALALAFQAVSLHAPSEERTDAYKLKETITTSQFGKIVMTGTETRTLGKPKDGRRDVRISFDVSIAEKQLTGAKADSWAKAELADLREPDHGWMDDLDRLTFSDGVAADAYPIFSAQAVQAGSQWTVEVNGITCRYTLDKLENGHAVISTDSRDKNRQGTLLRSGSWTVDVKTGRLLSWHLRSEVTYRSGGREIVDSSAELQN